MIAQVDFKKYCEEDEDYIRIQDTKENNGDLCFILDDNGYAHLYNCGEGYFFGVPIRSIGNMIRLYNMLTNKELKIKENDSSLH
jgi:hypothetical protein